MEKCKCEYVADIFFHVIFMSIIHLFHLIITILVTPTHPTVWMALLCLVPSFNNIKYFEYNFINQFKILSINSNYINQVTDS